MLKETVVADFKSLTQNFPGSMMKITNNLSQGKWPMGRESNPETSEYGGMLTASGRYKLTCRDSEHGTRTPGKGKVKLQNSSKKNTAVMMTSNRQKENTVYCNKFSFSVRSKYTDKCESSLS
jgi:hypothetical protein